MRETTNCGVYPATGGQQGLARFFPLLSQPSDVDGDCRVVTERPEATLAAIPSSLHDSFRRTADTVKCELVDCSNRTTIVKEK